MLSKCSGFFFTVKSITNKNKNKNKTKQNKIKTNLYLLLVLALLFNCKEEYKTVTNAKDYDVFLIAENKKLSNAKEE